MKPRDPWTLDTQGLLLAPLVLRAAELARRPLATLGVELGAFRALVTVRFLLDRRGSFGGLEGQFQLGFLLLLAFAWFSGLGVGVAGLGKFAKLPGSVWIGLVSLHAFAVSMVVLLIHLGTLLVDGTDVAPIAARPVSDRTLFAVRIAHLGAYTSAIASTSMFWPILLGWIGYPWWAVLAVVPVAVVLGCATAVGLVAAGFTLLLIVFGPGRFQRVAFWAQIGATACFFGGLQVLSSLVTTSFGKSAVESLSSWAPWIPPFSSGALFDAVTGGEGVAIAMRVLVALAAPCLLLVTALALASSGFVRGLSADVARELPARAKWPRARLGRLVCRTREELAGYGFAVSLVFRDKVFLRSVVPLVALLAGVLGGSRVSAGLGDFGFLAVVGALPVHLLALLPCALAEILAFTESADAAAGLDALPIERRVDVLRGALRGVILRIVAPLHAAAALILSLVVGGGMAVHIAIAAVASLAIGISVVPAMYLRMPFSHRPSPGEMSMRNVPPVFTAVCLAALTASIHLAASLHWISTAAAAIAAPTGLVLAWRRLERIRDPLPRAGLAS